MVTAALALWFMKQSVMPYYIAYGPDAFGSYWPHRTAFVLHTSGGTLALSAALFQLYSGLSGKARVAHRWIGRAYLAGLSIGSAGADRSPSTPCSAGVTAWR